MILYSIPQTRTPLSGRLHFGFLGSHKLSIRRASTFAVGQANGYNLLENY